MDAWRWKHFRDVICSLVFAFVFLKHILLQRRKHPLHFIPSNTKTKRQIDLSLCDYSFPLRGEIRSASRSRVCFLQLPPHLHQGFSSGGNSLPCSRDIGSCLETFGTCTGWGWAWGLLLESSWQRMEMLLNILQGTVQLPPSTDWL